MKKKKRSTFYIFILATSLIFVLLLLYVFFRKQIFPGIKAIYIFNFLPRFKIETTISNDGVLYWPLSNNEFITIDSSNEVVMDVNCNNNFLSNSNLYDLEKSKRMKFLSDIDKYMHLIGFNKVNSVAFTNPGDISNSYSSITGYKNDNGIICEEISWGDCIGWNPDSQLRKRTVFVCSTEEDFIKASKNQPYMTASNLWTTKTGEQLTGIAASVWGNYKEFYYLNAGSPLGSGWGMYVKKSGDKWIRLAEYGLSCETASIYKIPHQLPGAEKCTDSATNTDINNPN